MNAEFLSENYGEIRN